MIYWTDANPYKTKGKSSYVFPDDWSHEEGGQAVGADDEAVDGGRVALLLGKARVKGREEADGEGRRQGGGQ